MSTTKITPRVYAACLASYNAGILHGRWIDADQDADDIRDEIAAMLAASPTPGAEEFAIHDHEGLGDIGEFESIDRVAAIGQAVANAGDDAPALLAWLDNDNANDPDEFADHYTGQWESLAAFAEQFHDDCGDIPNCPLAAYIDWGAVGSDMGHSGKVWTSPVRWRDGGGVYVFWNR